MLRFLQSPPDRPHLHSFPTRRSSDLAATHRGRETSVSERQGAGKGAFGSVARGRTAPAERRSAHRRCCAPDPDRKSTRLNSSHVEISYAVFCLKKKTEPTAT